MSGWAEQGNGTSAVVFRLLLVVSLWRGPVLWAHEHDANCENLTTHLVVFHPDAPETWDLGWHWHLSLPDGRGPLSPDDKEPFGEPCDSLPALVSGSLFPLIAGHSSPATHAVAAHLAHSVCVSFSPANGDALRVGSRPGTGPSTQQVLCRMNC